jgi:UDP-N-acetyl-D-glucosamine dehydrogenase
MGNNFQELQERISAGRALIGVIGLGYVGLPLVLHFARKGFRVLGFDADEKKVEALNAGRFYIMHIPAEEITAIRFRESGSLFEATHDLKRLGEPVVLLICVPTPLDRFREPNLEYVEKSAQNIAATLRRGQLISLESTTYPGTTDDIIRPLWAQRVCGWEKIFSWPIRRNGKTRATWPTTCATPPRSWEDIPQPVWSWGRPYMAR